MEFDVNNLRIAAPCPVSWSSMKGDDRTRHCDLCELNVHNVEGMTRDEVARLIGKGGGCLCMRLVRRVDGTVMTKDCPVGLRAYRKRVAGLASAVFATVVGLFSVSYGQSDQGKTIDGSTIKISRSNDNIGITSLYGTLVDLDGAIVPGANLYLSRNKGVLPLTRTSNEYGQFSFEQLPPDVYELEVSGVVGFRTLIVRNLDLLTDKAQHVTLELEVAPVIEELLGVVAEMPMGDPEIVQKEIDFSLLKVTPRPTKRP